MMHSGDSDILPKQPWAVVEGDYIQTDGFRVHIESPGQLSAISGGGAPSSMAGEVGSIDEGPSSDRGGGGGGGGTGSSYH